MIEFTKSDLLIQAINLEQRQNDNSLSNIEQNYQGFIAIMKK